MSVGENIKRYREYSQMSIAKFAAATGIPMLDCMAIEAGQRAISSGELQNIARVLNATVDALLSEPQAEQPQNDGNSSVVMPIDELQKLLGNMKD